MRTKRIVTWCGTTALVVLFSAILIGCPVEEPAEPDEMVKFATSEEFVVDEEGLLILEEEYGLEFDEVYQIAIGLTHEALQAGDVDAALGFTTDGKIKELDLVKLKDDKKIFPAKNPAPVIREEVLENYPQIETIMAEITSQLDNETMIQLNYLVDIEEEKPARVARDWLLEKELITEEMKEPSKGEPVTISSKEFVEQKILRHIAVYALEDAGIPVEDRKQMVGTEAIRSALVEGEIDLCWEYTGIAWQDIYLEEKAISDSEKVYQKVAERDAQKGLIWLDYTPLDKTYTIMMRREQARELDITTISELAQWVEQVQAGEF